MILVKYCHDRRMISVEQLSKQISDLCPEDHLRSFLEENTRPDGRALDELRPIVLAKNVVQTADSSVLVRLGKTKVCSRDKYLAMYNFTCIIMILSYTPMFDS